MLQVFEDGSAVLTLLAGWVTIQVPAFDSAGDIIRIIIGG